MIHKAKAESRVEQRPTRTAGAAGEGAQRWAASTVNANRRDEHRHADYRVIKPLAAEVADGT